MQGRDPSSFIQAFSGSHQFILDYLLKVDAGPVAIRSLCAWLAGDPARSAELAQESLDQLPEHDVTTRGFVVLRIASGLALSGEMARGAQIAAEAMSISRATRNTHITLSNGAVQAPLYSDIVLHPAAPHPGTLLAKPIGHGSRLPPFLGA